MAGEDHWAEEFDRRRYLTPARKAERYAEVGGVCFLCNEVVPPDQAEWDHRQTKWMTGNQRASNFYPLHPACHAEKTAKDARDRAKTKRMKAKHEGTATPTRRPLKSGLKLQGRGFDKTRRKKMDGTVEVIG